MSTTPLHTLTPAQVLQALETSPKGLSQVEAHARLDLYGHNLLTRQEKNPILEKLLLEFTHPPTILLMLIGLVALVQSDWVLAIIIWGIVLVNTTLSFWREYRAEQAIERLRDILPSYARLVREGCESLIPSSQVVPGDILVLAEGDNIPADGRVLEEYGLRVNNANLTGEALPVRKLADPSLLQGLSDLDRPNLIFAGTSIASGTGRAVVTTTGMSTQFGRIARLTESIVEESTPFQKELNRLSRLTALVGLGIGALVILVGYFTLEFRFSEIVLMGLGIIVAVIPEGLVATLTLSLAAAVQRLAVQGVLVKKPSIVEKLGQVSVICTDKSGTLTQNQMTVRNIWVAGQRIKVGGVGYEPVGSFSPAPAGQPWQADLQALLESATACNNARINPPSVEHPGWTSLGDQTEAAMKVAAMKGGLREEELNRRLPRVHEIPFDARRKRMTTIHRLSAHELAYTKGAPREVLQLCTQVLVNGIVQPLNDDMRAQILAANDTYAGQSLRVLALARRNLVVRFGAYTPESVERDLVFLGLMAMMDPPRPQVEKAIRVCRQAGIRMVMITGDYGLTALSLARRLGMITSPNPVILTGSELDDMTDAALLPLLDKEVLFARMASEHKLRLVSAFQHRGDFVAVTGDGVNDAPALRKSDVGIAMGLVGTDVAKEAADIILTRDDFGAIITAIEEGRGIFDNIRKFITYIFSSNIPELLPFIVTASLPLVPLALSVRQILAIDMGTDMFPALALGIEKPEPDVMVHQPRPRNQPLLDRGVLARALWLGGLEALLCFSGFLAIFVLADLQGHIGLGFIPHLPLPPGWNLNLTLVQAALLASTAYHAGVVTSQAGNALACRSEHLRGSRLGWLSNGYLWAGIAVELVGIAVIVYVPALAHLFKHVALPPWMWIILGSYALIIYTFEWLRKAIARRFNLQVIRHASGSIDKKEE